MGQLVDGTVHIESTDEVRIALHGMGGAGPPLLLLHATGFCAKAYLAHAAVLATRFEVVGVDLRGHGEATSPASDEAFTWDRIASDVLAAVDHLGLGDVCLFGHSMGAAVGLMAAAGREGWLRQAYVYEPVVWGPGQAFAPGENPLGDGARRRREVFASRGEAMLRFASRPPFDVVRADCLWAYVTHALEDLDDGTVRLRCRGADEGRTYDGEWASTTAAIAPLTAPVTVASGAGTDVPADLAGAAAGALADSRLVRHDDLGHFGPFEAPTRIASEALAAFAAGRP